MPSLFSDDAARELVRSYREMKDRLDRLERQLRSNHRPSPREDFVLFKTSTANELTALASNTPGQVTDAKWETLNSSDDLESASTSRTITVNNVGKACLPKDSHGWAHREFKTGKFVASIPLGNVYIGKLDAQMSTGSTVNVSRWTYSSTASAWAATTETDSVIDWLLDAGETISSGKKVIYVPEVCSGKMLVVGAECE